MCIRGGTHVLICLGIGELCQVLNEFINRLTKFNSSYLSKTLVLEQTLHF